MSRPIWIVSLLSFAIACGEPEVIYVDSRGWFEPSQIDFGVRAVAERHEISGVFVNNLAREILVKVVSFSPADAVYSARTADGETFRGTTVRPGERLGIRIIFVPRDEVRYDTQMQVQFESTAVTLPVTGAGRILIPPTLELLPSRIDFFETELGRDVVRTLEIQNTGDLPANVERVLGSTGRPMGVGDEFFLAEHNDAALAQRFVLEPTESRTVDVHFKPANPLGRKEEKLTLEIAGADSVEIPVVGTAVNSGTLVCEPSPLDLGPVLRGDSSDERLTCTAHGGVFTVASVDMLFGSSDLISMPLPPSPGVSLRDSESMSFSVRLTGSGRAVRHEGTVLIVAAHGAQVEVPVYGSVVAPPSSDTRLSVQMSWNTDDTDLDLHLVRSGNLPFDPFNDCYFGRAHQNWGSSRDETDDAYLDADNRVGRGPEQINLAVAPNGGYDIYVHYYGGGMGTLPPPTQSLVSVYERGAQVFTTTTELAGCGALWFVGTITVTDSSVSVSPRGAIIQELGRARCP
ncbi:MAG: hypothetical protein HYV07_23260 [Deltaproteobacteria bacterium]|nr:hypothetical protein [Deltaproteobacteria bacterium]